MLTIQHCQCVPKGSAAGAWSTGKTIAAQSSVPTSSRQWTRKLSTLSSTRRGLRRPGCWGTMPMLTVRPCHAHAYYAGYEHCCGTLVCFDVWTVTTAQGHSAHVQICCAFGAVVGNNSPDIAPHTGAPAITVPMSFTSAGVHLHVRCLTRSIMLCLIQRPGPDLDKRVCLLRVATGATVCRPTVGRAHLDTPRICV